MTTENDPITPSVESLETYSKMHPADLAVRLQHLPVEEAQKILAELPEALAADTLSEMDPANLADLLASLSNNVLSRFFIKLEPNHVVDLLFQLPPIRRVEILKGMPSHAATRIKALLLYPHDTAGGIMSNRFIALRTDQTVEECHNLLRSMTKEETGDISYLYVTDPNNKLVGVLSLRNLLFDKPTCKIQEILNPDVKFLRTNDDQEKIAQLFEKYGYLGLPVVQEDGTLVGIVPAKEAIDIVQEEVVEDMQLMAGVSVEEHALTPWQKSIKPRFVWLNVNLATAFLAALVVSLFEDTIHRWTALAIFLPVIAGQGINAGSQTMTIIIRGLATGEISVTDGRKTLYKEFMLGLFNGLATGIIVGVAGFLWKGSFMLGAVAGAAMLLNMLAAALSGVLVPYGLKALKIDPALASVVIVTTVTDVAGFFFFLGLAALAIHWFGV